MFICVCNAITERQVQAAVAQGASTISDLQGQLGVASCCGCCHDTALEYLPGGRYAAEQVTSHAGAALVTDAANDSGFPEVATMVAVAVQRA